MKSEAIKNGHQYTNAYEGHLKGSWTGGDTPLLCRGRSWLLSQVVVVGVT